MSELPSCPACQSISTCANGDHDIDCKIDGNGAMKLKLQLAKNT